VDFGRKFKAYAVWCILEGQTMIRLAVPVAKALGIPLYTEVWDPPCWWLRENGVDKITQSRVLNKFDNAIKSSQMCATASWSMAEKYHKDYGVKTVPLIPSLAAERALPPSYSVGSSEEIIIGMAGQIYASNEWNALINALDHVQWRISGKVVKIRVLGRRVNLQASRQVRIEFLGWSSQEETIKLMSETDLLYCPYWFDPMFETVARLSFPSKLTTYLASGRPVFYHGPRYASPARFLEEHKAGKCCYSLDSTEIINSLTEILSDSDLYSKLTQNGKIAFDKFLTLETMKDSFAAFLQIDKDFLVNTQVNGVKK
jgi:glycosyltransferase involved in cell wall biosynthesis